MMGNRVQSFSHEVGSVIVRWYIGKGKGLADQVFSCEVVCYVDVLHLRIVDRVHSNVDARGIGCHIRYGNSVTELCECVEVSDWLTICSGKCDIFCFCGRRGNGSLFLREPGYSTSILQKSVSRYGTTGITIRRIIRVGEGNNGQRN